MLTRLTLALASLLLATVAIAQDAATWQQRARDDLAAIRATLISAHPGYIDDENPRFRHTVDTAYASALELVPKVHDYSSMLYVTRTYVTAFEDGHLMLSDDIREDVPLEWNGWATQAHGDKVLVSATAPSWPGVLPPVGARLVGCDGKDPWTLAAEMTSPATDRRRIQPSRALAVRYIGSPDMSLDAKLGSCEFELDGGQRVRLEQHYQAVAFMYAADIMNVGVQPRPQNSYKLLDGGVLWVRAGNFQPTAKQYADLQRELAEIRRMRGVRAIVFDVRGNGGGDSGIGEEIFGAATGGLEFDRSGLEGLPTIHAEWRVSDLSVLSAKRTVARQLKTQGDAMDDWLVSHLNDMLAARAAGEPWALQDTKSPRLTPSDIVARGGRLRRFTGTVAVLTDARCASACLDFVDLVKLVPGSVQLGQTTSADTVYIDTGLLWLPSGNKLVVPLKVWRNRLRGNNQPWVPDVVFDGDINDDVAVRRWVNTQLQVARHAETAGASIAKAH